MTKKELDLTRYQQVPGNPAFPPPSLRREEDYIERMIRRDSQQLDNTLPRKDHTK